MALGYRPNVCIILYNEEKKILLGERYGQPGIYQFPQGGIEDGDAEESVYREIAEELGIPREKLRIEKKLNATHQYDYSEVPAYASGKWRGQSQTFWLVLFLGDNSDINVLGDQPEFMGFRWCSPDEVRATAEPKRLPGYERPLQEVESFFKTL